MAIEREHAFQTTNWSLVHAAGSPDTERSTQALATLCEAYWPPLYAFVRSRGYRAEDARDLTQAFFVHLLEDRALEGLTPEGGRLLSFLLASLKNLLSDEADRRSTLKRGAGRTLTPLDLDTAESGYRLQLTDDVTPELLFEQRWATTTLQRALGRLRDQSVRQGKAWRFERLKGFLTGERPARSYHHVAAELEMSEDAVKTAVRRLRQRFGEALRAEISETVAGADEIDDEIRYLLSVVQW